MPSNRYTKAARAAIAKEAEKNKDKKTKKDKKKGDTEGFAPPVAENDRFTGPSSDSGPTV